MRCKIESNDEARPTRLSGVLDKTTQAREGTRSVSENAIDRAGRGEVCGVAYSTEVGWETVRPGP